MRSLLILRLRQLVGSDMSKSGKSKKGGKKDDSSSDDEDVQLNVGALINRLRMAQKYKSVPMHEKEVTQLLERAKAVLLSKPMLVECQAPVHVFGDIHGQFADLMHALEVVGWPGADNQLLFLGDYVDRGKFGMETMCLLLALKIQHADRIHLLRGNHESQSITRVYGFYDEVKRRFDVQMWRKFIDVFDCLPVSGLISSVILCMHGGLSPHLNALDDIRKLSRPADVPPGGLMCDLMWADPDKKLDSGWGESQRNISFVFAKDVVLSMTVKLKLDLVMRAHQVVAQGYELFADNKLITLFTAPNYCGEFTNLGAIANIDQNLEITLTFLDGCNQAKSMAA